MNKNLISIFLMLLMVFSLSAVNYAEITSLSITSPINGSQIMASCTSNTADVYFNADVTADGNLTYNWIEHGSSLSNAQNFTETLELGNHTIGLTVFETFNGTGINNTINTTFEILQYSGSGITTSLTGDNSVELDGNLTKTLILTNTETEPQTVYLEYFQVQDSDDELNDYFNQLDVKFYDEDGVEITKTTSIEIDPCNQNRTIEVRIDASSQNYVVQNIGGEIAITGNLTKDISLEIDVTNDVFNNDGIKLDEENPSDLEVYPGEDFSFDIDLSKHDHENLDDVEMSVKILKLEDSEGDDIEVDFSKFNLDDDEHDSFDASFDTPLNVDKGDYFIVLSLEGEYEQSNDDWKDFDFKYVFSDKVEVVKENDEVTFEYITMSPNNAVNAGDTVTISFNLINTGDETYNDGSMVKLYIDDLAITQYLELEDDLEHDSDNNREFSGHFLVQIPGDAEAKDYTVRLKFFDDDEDYIGDQKSETLILQTTGGSAEQDQNEESNQGNQTSNDGTIFLPSEWPGLNKETWTQVFWILGDVVLLIIAIYFLTLIFRRKR